MKYTRYLFACIMTTSLVCNSMEMQKEKSFKEITVVKKPRYAQYLTKDRVIVSDSGCSIINPVTNQLVRRLGNDINCSFAIHPNKKKIAVCDDYKNITIYDVKTLNPEWSTAEKCITKFIFSPINTTIFICDLYWDRDHENHLVVQHNYVTKERQEIYNGPSLTSIALHPTQNSIFLNTRNFKTFLMNNFIQEKDERLDILSSDYQYSHDGSFICGYGIDKVQIIDPTNLRHCYFYTNPRIDQESFSGKLYFRKAILNADSRIVITISIDTENNFGIIGYWDIAAQKYIDTVKMEITQTGFNADLSLAPDETELMITYADKCIIIPVPSFKINTNKFIPTL